MLMVNVMLRVDRFYCMSYDFIDFFMEFLGIFILFSNELYEKTRRKEFSTNFI